MARILILAFIVSMTVSTAEAQIFNRLQERAQEAVEQEIEKKAGEEIDRAAEQAVTDQWEKIFGERTEDGSSEGDGQSSSGFPFAMSSNVETADIYDFEIITTMEIESNEEDFDEPIILQLHFSEGEMYTGTKFVGGGEMTEGDEDVFLIYDFDHSAMIMLMSSEEGNFSFAYDWTQPETASATDLEEESLPEETFQPIGTKMIAGYESEGYESRTEEAVTEVWVNRDEDFGMGTLFAANEETKAMKGKIPEHYPSGMLMEMVSENLDTGEITTLRVTDIDKNVNVRYRMEDYPGMGSAGQ